MLVITCQRGVDVSGFCEQLASDKTSFSFSTGKLGTSTIIIKGVIKAEMLKIFETTKGVEISYE